MELETIQEYRDYISTGFDKIFITVLYSKETQEFVDVCKAFLVAYPLPGKYLVKYSKSDAVIDSLEITSLPTVNVRSNPSQIDKNFIAYPAYWESLLESDAQSLAQTVANLQETYFKEIETLITTNPIVLFIVGTPEKPMYEFINHRCRFTSKLIQKLQAFKIKFTFFDIEADKMIVPFLPKYSKWPTFPQVFVDGKIIGGSDAVCDLIDKGQFEQLIPKAAFMSVQSKLEQVQLMSKYLVLIDGPPDQNCDLALYLHSKKVQFQFYNIKLDQVLRTEILNSLSLYVESSHDLDKYLLYKNTIYDYQSLLKEPNLF